jgi:predicted transcriptional regulator YheO
LEIHKNLLAIKQLLKGMHSMLGNDYEVILHDLSHMETSIIALEGNVTNRKVGGPATNYLIHLLREHGDKAKDSIGYKNIMPNGKVVRSSTIFIRDDNNKIIGSLCINQDLTDYTVANKLLERLVQFRDEDGDTPKEMFSQDISEVMESIIDSEMDALNKPVNYMHKEDKLALVVRLEKKGIFDVKNSVEYVAEKLGVSSFTIYNYLKEIRVRNK